MNKQVQVLIDQISASVRVLIAETHAAGVDRQCILERLMILKAELEEAIKAVNDMNSIEDSIAYLKGKGVREVMVKPFKDRWTVWLDLEKGSAWLGDTLMALAGPEGFSKAFQKIELKEIIPLLRCPVLYIEINGHRFHGWDEVKESYE